MSDTPTNKPDDRAQIERDIFMTELAANPPSSSLGFRLQLRRINEFEEDLERRGLK